MAGYRFRLDAVLRVRRIERDRAAARMAESQRVLAAADLRRAEAEGSCGRASDRAAGLVSASTATFIACRVTAVNAAASLRLAELRVAEAGDVVAGRRGEWSQAATRVRGLERLDERRRVEHLVEERRREARTIDDLVTSRRAERR